MAASLRRTALTYLLAALAGLAGAAAAWIFTGFLADFLLGLSGMSDREGYRAMVAFFTFAPFGALAGLVLGVWLVLRHRGGYRGFASLAGRGALVIAGLAGVIALGLWAYTLTNDVLVRNGPPPLLKFEIRFPANAVLPPQLEGVSIDLNTEKNSMPANFSEAPADGGRPVIAGSVELYFRAFSRILVLRMKDEPDRLFLLNLAANPPASPEFGPWQHVDYVADGPGQEPRKATEGDDYAIRYRVERAD
jgi:MFS family permease